MKKALIICSLILLATGFGCAALSHYVTPADIDRKAVKYVVDANVAEPNDFAGYPNYLKAKKLQEDVDIAHTTIQFALQQQIQKDNLEYGIHAGVTTANFVAAQDREQKWFGEKGYLSLGLGMLGMGGFTGLLGLMRKRPGDITKNEMESAIAQIEGKSAEDLTEERKQLVQVVRGVQKFIDKNKDGMATTIEELKNFLDGEQDISTKATIASLKKLL